MRGREEVEEEEKGGGNEGKGRSRRVNMSEARI